MPVIAESVWQTWRERDAIVKKTSIALLFTADAAPEAAVAAMREAIGDVMQLRFAKADAAVPGEDEFRTGNCSFARVPEGVLLRIDEGPEDFAGLLEGIAAGLRARGIEGSFDVYEPSGLPDVPELVDLFECHLRLRGERAPWPNGRLFWSCDPDALIEAAGAGIGWCRDNGQELPLSLRVGLLPPMRLDPGEDIERYVLEGIASTGQLGVVQLTSAGPDRFRTFAVDPSQGRAGLIEGGDAARDDWQTALSHATDALCAAAPWTVYGFVKRGSRRMDAVLGTSLPSDWLDVPHMNALRRDRWAFEDQTVPDVFGVQLLSAGHREHIPAGPDWRVEELAAGRVLVEHLDPASWFDGSLVRFGGHGNPFYDPFPRTPQLLTRAREDFDALLYKDAGPPAYAAELGDRRFVQP